MTTWVCGICLRLGRLWSEGECSTWRSLSECLVSGGTVWWHQSAFFYCVFVFLLADEDFAAGLGFGGVNGE